MVVLVWVLELCVVTCRVMCCCVLYCGRVETVSTRNVTPETLPHCTSAEARPVAYMSPWRL